MKRVSQLLLCVMASVCVAPAVADGRGHGRNHGHFGAQAGSGFVVQHHGGHHGHHYRGGSAHIYHGGRHNNWVGPVVGAALLGGAIYAATTPGYVMQPQVVVPPPAPYAVGPRVAYYCSTAQMYYPQVPTCQVPWQVLNY